MTTPTQVGWIDERGILRDALEELVSVKDLKDRTEAIHFAGPSGTHGENWEAAYEAGRKEYLRRQPIAWATARVALATSAPAQPMAAEMKNTLRRIINGAVAMGWISADKAEQLHAALSGAGSEGFEPLPPAALAAARKFGAGLDGDSIEQGEVL